MEKQNAKFALSNKFVIGEVLARNSRKYPEKLALVFQEKRFSYKDFNNRVNRLANYLYSQGVRHSDKVGILLYNGNEILEAYFAANKLGAVAVPVNFRFVRSEIEYILNHSDSSVLIYDEKFTDIVKEIKSSISNKIHSYLKVGTWPGLDALYEESLARASDEEPLVLIDNDDAAFIMYTSGTTGRPKGAVLSHMNLLLNTANCCLEFGFTVNDSFICIPPLFHVAAFAASLFFFYMGGHVIVMHEFNAAKVLKQIEKEKPTCLFLVPAMWNFLFQIENFIEFDTSSLRIAITGTSIMPVKLKKQLMEKLSGIDLFDCFGQTEMSPVTTILKPKYTLLKPDSVGQAVVNVEVRVVNDEDRDVSVGEIGEIIYRGPTTMLEYYKDQKATVEALKNGWFHSGDLVRMDEEGFIYVADRKKDMIISGGENVYPAEVEGILIKHPKILEVAIIGVPSEKWGESVHAVIVPKQGVEISKEEIIDFCAQNLAGYKKPRSIEFIELLPRNAAGKVVKTILRENHGKSIKY